MTFGQVEAKIKEYDGIINENNLWYSSTGRFVYVGDKTDGDGTWKIDLEADRMDYKFVVDLNDDASKYPDLHDISIKELKSLLK